MPASPPSPGVLFTHDGAIWNTDRGHAITYKRFNGIYYHADTAPPSWRLWSMPVHAASGSASTSGTLRRAVTGWRSMTSKDYIGNSLGPLKVPLLIHNRRSSGGPAILDHCVVKIKRTGTQGAVPLPASGVSHRHVHDP